MDIYSLGDTTFKLKGKAVTTLVSADKVSVESGDRTRDFAGPGEYETNGVAVTGVLSKFGVIFVINQDNLNLVHLGSQVGSLTEEQTQAVEEADILFVSPKAASTVSQLEPKVIVPIDGEEKEKLLKELGAEGTEATFKLTITKDKLPEEPMVVVLQHG